MNDGTNDPEAQPEVGVSVTSELKPGFTKIPNAVMFDPALSAGAKCLYGLLLSYAWYRDEVFPGQRTLAEGMCCSDRMVRRYLQELSAAGLCTTQQRGLGKTQLYKLSRPH